MAQNVAEWRGLIAVLMAAQRYQATPLTIIGDSQLVVYQFTGTYATRQPHLATLRQEAIRQARGLTVTVQWVPRAKNQEADALSKQALRQMVPLRFDPHQLERIDATHWLAHGTQTYHVDIKSRTCTCPAYTQHHQRPCKHLATVLMQ